MKRIFFFVFLFISIACSAQRLSLVNTYGSEWYRIKADTLLGLPNDTFAVPTLYKSFPFLASKSGTLYVWNSTLWVAAGGSSLTANNGTSITSNVIQLGGTLVKNTSIPLGGFNLSTSGSGVITWKGTESIISDNGSPVSNLIDVGFTLHATDARRSAIIMNNTLMELLPANGNIRIGDAADPIPQSLSSTDSVLVRDNAGNIKTRAQSAIGSGGGTPGGSNTQVQFNDGGSFGANSGFIYDKTNKIVTIDSSLIITKGFLNLGSSTTGKINFGSTGSGVTTAGTSPGGGVWFGPGAASGASMATTATDWVAIGAGALAIQGPNSRSNIAEGKVALSNCDSCSSSIGIGANTGNKAGQFATEVGHEIAQNSLHPNNITAVGYRVMNACINCHDNTAMGKQALESCTDCSYMTSVGLLAGSSVTTGSQDVFLGVGAGYQAGLADPTVSNKFSVFSSSGFSGNALMWGEINNKRLCINCAEGTALTYTLDVRGKLAVSTVDFISSKDTLLYQDPTDGQIKKTKFVGSTSLTPVGTGYDIGITNTGNVKRLLAGYSISLDSATSNSVKITVDTATLAPYIRSTIPGAASATWNLTGNASVTTAQFLGTTDANKIRFRTNNTERGYWDSTGGTLFIGAPTYVNNTYGLIIQSPTNNSSQAIKVYYNNLSGSAELGAGRLLFSGSADIAWSSGTGKINSPNGLKIGDANTPTAFLHIVPGTASAGKGQIKLSEGVKLTTAENGVITFDTTSSVRTLLFDVGTTHYTIARTLTGSATLDFTSTAALSTSDLTITVTGAADGDEVDLGVPNGSEPAGSNLYGWRAWVSSANTVTVRLLNFNTVTAIDPASGTFRVTVIKH